MYVHQIGCWDNALAYDGKVPSWGHSLIDAGLSPVSVGKLHYRGVEDSTGFVEQILPMHIAGRVSQVWASVRDPLPDTRRRGQILGAIGPGDSKYNRYDRAVAERAAELIWSRRDDPPRVLFSSFAAPHFPLVAPRKCIDLYPVETIGLPSLRIENGYEPHPWQVRMSRFLDNDSEFDDDTERRRAIAAYHALCTFVDVQIGRILDSLEEAGQADDTLDIFCSNHG